MNPSPLALCALASFVACGLLPAQGPILGVSWTGAAVSIDSATGVGAPLGPTGASSLNSLAFGAQAGRLYTVSGSTLYSVSPTTGVATSVVTLTVSDVRGLAVTPAGVCYGIVNGTPDKLYTIDLSTGVATLVGNTGNSSIQALASDSGGNLLAWAVNPTVAGQGSLLTINASTGVATAVGPPTPASIQALAFSPAGVLYGCNTGLFTINPSTGAATPVGPANLGDVRGIDFAFPQSSGITFMPANGQVGPGGTLTINYSAPGHAGETFAPIPSCTLGSFFAPPLPQPLGIAWDVCTDFYFNDPNSSALMPLSGIPGSFAATLNFAGQAQGWVFPPAVFPPGLNIPVYLTFVSWDSNFIVTVHGVSTFLLY
jgi:hypothetical protein